VKNHYSEVNLLINCSNLNKGGGLQVAHSFIHEIKCNQNDNFWIILSSSISNQIDTTSFPNNFNFLTYNISSKILGVLTGRNSYLDKLVEKQRINVVFTLFGPSYWRPKVKHVMGFAKAQYIYLDSPFHKNLSIKGHILLKIKRFFHLKDFRKSQALITENQTISSTLNQLIPNSSVYTVTNFHNQIFDQPLHWKRAKLNCNGYKILSVTANYPHKNLSIIPKVIDVLTKKFRGFEFTFILTIKENELSFNKLSSNLERIKFLGPVELKQVPKLYEQCDAVFVPTLIECFTANYPEAMKMKKPILTSDLEFAHGLCGEAAEYFDPLDPEDIANKIYALANNKIRQQELIELGEKQLEKFDDYKTRARKYLEILEYEANHPRP
jgi:glycosyltransferase involved in cell wall biosynthesis